VLSSQSEASYKDVSHKK